jgi:peptidoglycan/xylan/chitin deacetylase (PgdA/CDA1 family)
MIAVLKQSSFSASRCLGLTSLVAASAWRRERLLVLCYHGVSLEDEHEWDPELYISPAALGRRLDALTHAHCAVLPLEEASRRLYAGTLPERAVTITFDDAYYDFKVRAYPLLSARGYPATVYVTTEQCERRLPVLHLFLSYVLWKYRQFQLDARGIAGLDRKYMLARPVERKRAVAAMRARMRQDRMNTEDEAVFTREVMERAGVDVDRVRRSRVLGLMTPADLAEVSEQGMAIELHTHRHRSPEDPDEFIEDLRLNRAKLQTITGRRPRHFCYPNGIYRSSYLPRLEREGIETATTCDPDLASSESHRLLLPRFIDNEMGSDLRFEAWMTGVASWLPRRTRKANGGH